jgi:multiple sugar transport system substrate-binding protein
VEIESPNPLYTAVLAQAAAGTAPDLSIAHPRDSRPLLDAGALLPLDAHIRRDKSTASDILPNLWGYFEQDGKQYYVPNNSAPHALYYNRSLFQQRGLKPPEQYEREGRWTWDAFLDVSRQLMATGGEPKVWAIDWFWANLDVQLAFLWPMGGDLWDKAVQRTLLDTRDSLEAIQYQADLTTKHRVSLHPDEKKELGAAAGFQHGRIAMFITTNAIVQDFAEAPFEKGVVPVPAGKAGRVIRNVPFGLHLLRGSKHPDAAWEYAAFQAGLESEKIMLADRVTVPWHKSTVAAPEWARTLYPWQSAQVYVETVNKVRPTIYPTQFTEIQKLYTAAYTAVYAGEKTAAQGVGEIKGQIDALLKKP